MYILATICVLLIALNAFQQVLHQREKKDLHNRLMSREYPEYVHFDTIHKMQMEEEKNRLKNQKKEQEELLKKPLPPDELEKQKIAEGL